MGSFCTDCIHDGFQNWYQSQNMCTGSQLHAPGYVWMSSIALGKKTLQVFVVHIQRCNLI